MSKKKKLTNKKKKVQPKQKKKSKNFWNVLAAMLVAIVFYNVVFKSETPKVDSIAKGPIGPVDLCRQIPPIAKARGLTEPLMIDLRQLGYNGIWIIEGKENGKILQLPEWDDAGHLGPYALDQNGNIYTAPVPHVSLEINKPEDQNRIMKVDGQTGKMSEFIRFPRPSSVSHNNPFGVMGIAFDCDTKSIYVTSIAGSGPDKSLGIIYQVDVETKEIINQLEGIDAIGIGIYITKNGKRLFWGSARDPEVFSIALGTDGNFIGQASFEFSLAAQEGGSADRAHRIRFFQNRRMEVKGIEFGYSLMAASDPMRNIYNFSYNSTDDTWVSEGVRKQ